MTALDEQAALENRVRKAERKIEDLETRLRVLTTAVSGLIRERRGDGPH